MRQARQGWCHKPGIASCFCTPGWRVSGIAREGGAGIAAAGSSGLQTAGSRFSLLTVCRAAASFSLKNALSDCRLVWKSGMTSRAPFTLHHCRASHVVTVILIRQIFEGICSSKAIMSAVTDPSCLITLSIDVASSNVRSTQEPTAP